MSPITRCALLLLLLIGAFSGSRADFPIRLTANADQSPVVAYNSTDHQYLVVWSELIFNGTIWANWVLAQRVAEDGTLLGSAFVIFNFGANPAVAFNSAANEYLVAFNPGGGFVGQRISNTGALLGQATTLMDTVSHARLLYNTLTGQYLFLGAMLVETSSGSGFYNIKVKSRKIDASGQALNSPQLVEYRAHGYQPPEPAFGAAFAPIQSPETPYGRYLVAIGRGVALVMLDSDGGPIDIVRDPDHSGVRYRYLPFRTGSNVGGEFGVDVAYGTSSSYSMTGPAFLVVWADANNSFSGHAWSGIYGGFVDAQKIEYLTTDVIQDKSFPVSFIWDHWARDPEVVTWRPRVAFNPPSQKFSVVWRETPGTNPQNGTLVNHIRGADVFERIPSGIADNVVISAAASSGEDPQYPVLAASTTSEHALVLWQDYRDKGTSSANIYGNVARVADPVPPPPPPPPTTTWVVTNTNDAGTGSLRQAILSANARSGLDTITFNIPGTALHTIQPLSELPPVTDPVLIDGYTQPGSSPNTSPFPGVLNTVLMVQLDGTKAGASAAGLRLNSGNTTVRGLVINNFQGSLAGGIVISGSGGNNIEGNFIGTDAAGKAKLKNDIGVHIDGVPNNRVGGTTPGARNLISGNDHYGVLVQYSGATGNVIQGNYLGADVTGNAPLGNQSCSVRIEDAAGNIVGGEAEGAGNLMSGNGVSGPGIHIRGAGVWIGNEAATGNKIAGNRIGTNAAGTAALDNSQDGIFVALAVGNIIGGAAKGAGNLISGNSFDGVSLGGDSNILQGNLIGSNISGTAPLKNANGILVAAGNNNLIGGLNPGARNLVSGNLSGGILISFGSSGNRVEGNWIGTMSDGSTPLGNGIVGVQLSNQAHDNTIGGIADGAGNLIAHNGPDGVIMSNNAAGGNRISSNSIFDHSRVGIDLQGGSEGPTGATLNDLGDSDLGPNDLQNYPILTFLMGGSFLSCQGILNSQPNITYRLEFFSTPQDQTPTGRDGKTYLGWTEVTTDGSGNASFDVTIGTPVSLGESITVTATDPDGNTSEFSAPLVVTLVPGAEVVTNTLDQGLGSLRQAILNANAKPGRDTIAFNIPGAGPHVIAPATPLPALTDPVVIDGFTQPGSKVNTNDLKGPCNAVLKIVLSGSALNNLQPPPDGLRISGGGSTVRGLAINSFAGYGVVLDTRGGDHIEGNYIGTDDLGLSRHDNTNGVFIDSVGYNYVGGTTPECRNIISGNKEAGIVARAHASRGNRIQGNYIGLDATGTGGLGNLWAGIDLRGAPSNTLGGIDAGAGNVIGGGNNSTDLAFSSACGVVIAGEGGNTILGNFIGTNAAGTDSLPNRQTGIDIYPDAPGNVIGGTSPGARNVISGNAHNGIVLLSDSNTVQGNYIGTDITGAKEVHNGYNGIHVGACSNLVGGRTLSAGNVISGNNDAGIAIMGHATVTGYVTARNNRLEGNRIGTRADGASPLGNKICGVRVMEGSEDNMIGDTALAAGNIIAFNHNDGVLVAISTFTLTNYPMHTRICANSVYGNSRIGINLSGGTEDTWGITANHPGGPVKGPNGLQNYPVLSAVSGGGALLYQGSLNGQPNTTYRVEVFATAKEHTANGRDGETFLGYTAITTDTRGEAAFSGTAGVPVAEGRLITATATDTAGNTSEFSAPVVVGPALSVNGQEGSLPRETALMQNYPNPFNPTTMIRYALPHRSHVRLTLFNTLGQWVAELVNGEVEAGYHLVRFDAGRLASGVYFYRLEAGNFVQTRKMVLTH